MPYVKKRRYVRKPKKAFKKKRVYKKRRGKRINPYSSNIGLPLRKTVKLIYCEQFVVSPVTAGLAATQRMLINSMFDPNSTGTGHQPLGFDQWALHYSEYLVKGAKITTTFTNVTPGNSPIRIGHTYQPGTSLDHDLTDRLERQRWQHNKILLGAIDSKASITSYFSTKKFFAVKDLRDEHQMTALITGSPTLPAYCIIWAQEASGTGAFVEDLLCEVKIEFIAEFIKPIAIGPS